MKKKGTYLKTLFIFLIWFNLFSCDPGLHGDLKVFNDSSTPLTINLVKPMGDTTSIQLQPNTKETIHILGHIGSNQSLDCCPCETIEKVIIKSSIGQIKKDSQNKDNWIIPNKSKLKKFGGPDVKCEFHVTQADI